MGKRGGSQRVVYTPEVLAEARRHEGFFLETILPRMEKHLRRKTYLWPPEALQREDFLAEATANAWKMFLDVFRKGKDPVKSMPCICKYAVLGALSGRRVNGCESQTCPLSQRAQHLHQLRIFIKSMEKYIDSTPCGV